MPDAVLTINAGSSSLKFCVSCRSGAGEWKLQARGQVDGIGLRQPSHLRRSQLPDHVGVSDQRVPLEQALEGTPVKDVNNPIEVRRVVHAYDPCVACAIHVVDAHAAVRP
mgnify:CR=1 FL=1